MSSEEEFRDSVAFLRLPLAAKRRRARPVLDALRRVARIAVVVVPLLAAATWVLRSPVFALSGVVVEGTTRVDAEWVRSGAAEFRGRNLVRLDLSVVRQRLLDNDWIRSVEIRKLLPDRLWIAVTEHQPAALLVAADALYFLDQDGSMIAKVLEPEDGDGWLLVKAGPPIDDGAWRSLRGRALDLARRIETARPDSVEQVREVEALAPGGFRLRFEGIDFPILVVSETAIPRLALLDRLLPRLENLAPVRSVDLRFTRRILIKPALVERGDSHLG